MENIEINIIKDNQSSFLCQWKDCDRWFNNVELLANHVNGVHATASAIDGLYYCCWYGCERSERGFNARYKMLTHVRTHTKEKPHTCQLCNKQFSRAENLKIHMRSHSGEKPYICSFEGCTKAYSNSSDRFKHSRTHTIDKPYVCKVDGCHKRYTDPSSLRKHTKTFQHSIQNIKSLLPDDFQQMYTKTYDRVCYLPNPNSNPNVITTDEQYILIPQMFPANAYYCPIRQCNFNCYPMDATDRILPFNNSYALKAFVKRTTTNTSICFQASNHNDLQTDKPLDLTMKAP